MIIRSACSLIIAAVAILLMTAVATRVQAADGLPEGCHTATEAEVAAGAPAGRPVCSGDTTAGITGDAGQAKAYLLSIARDLRNSQAPPRKERIDPLNNSFAICAAKFLKAYTDASGPIYVVSAFRCGPHSPENLNCDRTENARAGGASLSNHQYGLAMDVNPADGDYATLHTFANSNPQFGVWFRLGMGDRPHLEPKNKNNPSCSGVEGTPVVMSNGAAPSSGLSSAARNFLSAQPVGQSAYAPTAQQSQQMCTLPDGNIVPCSAIANLGGSQTAPSGATAPQQALPASQQPILAEEKTPVSSLISSAPGVSSEPDDMSPTSTEENIPAFDQILAIANPESSDKETETENPFELIVAGSDALALGEGTQAAPNNGAPPENPYGPVVPAAQQTFISQDLSQTPRYPPQQLSTLQTILATMRDTLLNILAYLQPFGRPGISEYE